MLMHNPYVQIQGNAGIRFELVNRDALNKKEYTPVIQVEKPGEITNVELIFQLKVDGSQGYYIHNGICTNDFVRIYRLGEQEKTVSRDFIIFSNQEHTEINCFAFTSFHKYYTDFSVTKKEFRIRYQLEKKRLEKGSYLLESFLWVEEMTPDIFLEYYASVLQEKYQITLPKNCPIGWSSWSCVYDSVDEQMVRKEAKLLKKLVGEELKTVIQIDDGWQTEMTFSASVSERKETFPSGMKNLKEYLDGMDCELGLWIAPTMMDDRCSNYKRLDSMNLRDKDGNVHASFGPDLALAGEVVGNVYPLDLEQGEVLQKLFHDFQRMKEEYGAVYFKLDFLIRSLLRATPGNEDRITYQKSYSIEAYQEAMSVIRKAVGEDSFLMACGAPIGESIGIFNAIRVSPDITWDQEAAGHPGYWKLIEWNSQNIFMRSFYQGKVFYIDPDALVVRDKILMKDDFAPTFEEAKVWATSVALSGGTIMVNERLEELAEERIGILKRVLNGQRITARPVDYLEYPLITQVYAKLDTNKILVAVYNWEEVENTAQIDLLRLGIEACNVYDCWEEKELGEAKERFLITAQAPHSVRVLLFRRKEFATTKKMECVRSK